MAKMQTAAKEKQNRTSRRAGSRAIDNLKFIRDTMERSTHFTAVPGYGGIFMGVDGDSRGVYRAQPTFFRDWLIVWFVEAFGLCYRPVGDVAEIEGCQYAAYIGAGKKICDEFSAAFDLRMVVHARTLAIRAF